MVEETLQLVAKVVFKSEEDKCIFLALSHNRTKPIISCGNEKLLNQAIELLAKTQKIDEIYICANASPSFIVIIDDELMLGIGTKNAKSETSLKAIKNELYGFLKLIRTIQKKDGTSPESPVAKRQHEEEMKSIDKQTSRFVRHEIKNHILSCLSECDKAREALEEDDKEEDGTSSLGSTPQFQQNNDISAGITQNFDDQTLSKMAPKMALTAIDTITEELSHTLDVLVNASRITSILSGNYTPEITLVDLSSICAACGQNTEILVNPQHCLVETDPALIRFIFMNAISNAAKYGAKHQPILIDFSIEESLNRVSHDTFPTSDTASSQNSQAIQVGVTVVNQPGPHHDRLLTLKNPSSIFEPGTRCHDTYNTDQHIGRRVSSGDGAWIMKKCLESLRGTCSIHFSPKRTSLIITFSASRPRLAILPPPNSRRISYDTFSPSIVKDFSAASKFAIPSGTIFCGLDDSAAQRHCLAQIFKKMGGKGNIATKIWGEDAASLRRFLPEALDLIAKSTPDTRIVFFLDKNLHYAAHGNNDELFICGIQLGNELIHELNRQNLRKRAIVLLRSAEEHDDDENSDSLDGSIPKTIMSSERCLQALEPIWNKHFGITPSSY
uniref:Histidine kinase domain-containing protein n=1 Tax=Aureoumbra lagunensis TaxID=44058 RepID=A0A7S3JXQ3_9STRA